MHEVTEREVAFREQSHLECERKRIACALHDELGQTLAALRMDLAVARQLSAGQASLMELITHMDAVTLQATSEMRRIIVALHPRQLDELGLALAAKALLLDWSARAGVRAMLTTGGELDALSPGSQLALYRILQESLTNIFKYAKARNVAVSLQGDRQQVRMKISDDGVGIDVTMQYRDGAFGWIGMRDLTTAMGGTLEIRSAPASGTQIDVCLSGVETHLNLNSAASRQ